MQFTRNQNNFGWENKAVNRAYKCRAGQAGLNAYQLKMWGGTGVYTIFGVASFVLFLYSSFGDVFHMLRFTQPRMSFVQRNGSQFMVDGKPLYVNGWNSYWLMSDSVDYSTRPRVKAMLRAGAQMGLSVCRTWAFNDGGYNALQLYPGKFDEGVFKALDYVIVEARRHGIRIIFSLVNNLNAYGGKGEYVRWARDAGVDVGSSNDSFFSDPTIRGYYKNYVKRILTRKNSLSGIQYRDEPAIFAWELMNEPRCLSDVSGQTLQAWITEMAQFLKSIDGNHLLTVGHEGFYGPTTPEKIEVNPGDWAQALGVDFMHNSAVEAIDFASVHAYPDSWVPDKELEGKLIYFSKWVKSHIEDGEKVLKKPVLFTEFGLSSLCKDYEASHRDLFFKTMYDKIYESAKEGGAGAGAMVWQFVLEGMEEYGDEFSLIPWQRQSTYNRIIEQSCRLQILRRTEGEEKQRLSAACASL